jgi:hypothetical protein
MSLDEKLKKIAENEQKVFDAGYAKGKAEGGGGASNPTAEAVVAFINKSEDTDVFWSSVDGLRGMFVLFSGKGRCLAIIPPMVTAIDDDGMQDIGGNRTLVLSLPKEPPNVNCLWYWSINGFNNPPGVIYVLDDSVDAYKTALGWSEFADIIKPMSNLTVEVKFVDVHIGDVIYQMPLGMTWREWINSEYYYQESGGSGTFSYIDINIYGNYVGFGPGGVMCMLYPDTMDIVRPDDIIDPAIHYQGE